MLLAGLVGLALLIARPNMTWRGLIMWGGAALVCFAVVLAPYLILNLRLTGGLLPNTAAAKRAESAPVLAQPLPVAARQRGDCRWRRACSFC